MKATAYAFGETNSKAPMEEGALSHEAIPFRF